MVHNAGGMGAVDDNGLPVIKFLFVSNDFLAASFILSNLMT
jgi:hypothetical protein